MLCRFNITARGCIIALTVSTIATRIALLKKIAHFECCSIDMFTHSDKLMLQRNHPFVHSGIRISTFHKYIGVLNMNVF